MASNILERVYATAVAHGYDGPKPRTITAALDALNDSLAGSDQPAAKTIGDCVGDLSDNIGGDGGGGTSFGTPHEVCFVNYDSAAESFEYEPGGFIATPQGPDDPDFSTAKIGQSFIYELGIGDDMLAFLLATLDYQPVIAAGLTAMLVPVGGSEVDIESLESSHPLYILQPVMGDEYFGGWEILDVPDTYIEIISDTYQPGEFLVAVTVPDIGEELMVSTYDDSYTMPPILAINVHLAE